MNLAEWVRKAAVSPIHVQGESTEFHGVSSDSRSIQPGNIFVAMPSARLDPAAYIPQAIERGAVATVVATAASLRAASDAGLPYIHLQNEGHALNTALGRLARAARQEDPSEKLDIIAITGTNGKTTTAWMLRDALEALGRKTAYLGTLGLKLPGVFEEGENTTPFPIDLWNLLDRIVAAGCDTLVLEASSHALSQRRLAAVSMVAGVFTNLTQDHLDYHGTMAHYSDAKRLLFTEVPVASRRSFVAILNQDERVTAEWVAEATCPTRFFSAAEYPARDVSVDRISISLPSGEMVDSPVGGTFNVENLRATAATLSALGYAAPRVVEGLRAVTPVPGRFEPVPNETGIGVIVDYAHTPDSLEKLLESVKELNPSRVITVFGCGGDRDRTKRPLMARAASLRSDLTVVTSDNPRTEDPESILREVEQGIEPDRPFVSFVDRREAIFYAVRQAKSGDIVVIAGKGHETYQIIGQTKHPMDDRAIAREALKEFQS
jgi:UDP-N-acetylmuramoyl-L-alanyl-D-glutamate--2,6-diaminopimelate ligase